MYVLLKLIKCGLKTTADCIIATAQLASGEFCCHKWQYAADKQLHNAVTRDVNKATVYKARPNIPGSNWYCICTVSHKHRKTLVKSKINASRA